MHVYTASYLIPLFGFVTSSILTTNQSHVPPLNASVANPYSYVIGNVSPPVTIAFSNLLPDRVDLVDPPSVYMCAIENLFQICRSTPRGRELPRTKMYAYGTVTIRFDLWNPGVQPYFTYNIACAVMRGLPEFMTSNNWWFDSFVHVISEGYIVGTAVVWNPDRGESGASVDVVGPQSTPGSAATA